MKIVNTSPGSNLLLGRQGENKARAIVFYIGPWVETYGAGVAQLLHQRKGDHDPYPVVITQEDNEVRWVVSEVDTSLAGAGRYELHYYVGDTLVKSSTGDTFVEGSMMFSTDPPDPYQGWFDRVEVAGSKAVEAEKKAMEAASAAAESAESAEATKKEVATAVASAAQSETNAKKSEENAKTYESNAKYYEHMAMVYSDQARSDKAHAEEAAAKAASSEGNAKAAEESANKAKADAENASSKALNYSNSAQSHQQGAETARSQASTYAKAANSSATRAESSATAAAQSEAEAKKAAEEATNAGGIKTVNGQSPDENGNVQIEVGSGSGVEVTAKPGQLIRVKETDENGNPTAWEAAEDMPWAEGGRVEVLAETMVDLEEDGLGELPLLNLVAGETYVVNWNGTEYECVAQDASHLIELECVALGDLSIAGMIGNGEPFVIQSIPPYNFTGVTALDGTVSTSIPLSIYADGEVVHPLDPKYLPEGVPYVYKGYLLEETDATEATDDTFGKCWIINKAPNVTVGETYTVIHNGVPYECVCIDTANMGVTDGSVVLGNLSVVGGENTGEPFVMLLNHDKQMVVALDLTGATSVRIGIMGKVGHKMDNRCLPDGVPTVFTVNITGDFTNSTADKTFAEILERLMSGNTIIQAYLSTQAGGFIMPLVAFAEDSVGFSVALATSGNKYQIVTVEISSDNTVSARMTIS